jgi:poly(A) polymerase
LYYDPVKEQVIDYVNGVKDIKAKRLMPVIPLDIIFKDDPVRMIRAVKYAAGTGFHLPSKVRRAILKDSALLSPVSPSRLTEELIKILNSGSSYEIVSLALRTNVFMHLQPSACALLYEKPGFEKKYLQNLKNLDALIVVEPDACLGKKLSYIIYDFIESLTDWKKETEENPNPAELYSKTWTQCRNFVLPMNPPRVELEYAIRTCLKKLGVNTKIPKSAFTGKKRKSDAENEERPKPAKERKKPAPRRKKTQKAEPPVQAQ